MTVKVNSVTKGDWFNYHYLQEVFPTALYARQSLMTAEENDILIKKITELREIFNEGDQGSGGSLVEAAIDDFSFEVDGAPSVDTIST